ncbi:hypothetical protein GE09DRAFT_59450 [Coniochaeta sp. 2T2.1]|nr:hypothetical protein GE09DRAFT_59450 [Coniochaeta sp. 2T2.1]
MGPLLGLGHSTSYPRAYKYLDGEFRAAGTSKPLYELSRNRRTLEVCGAQQCIIDEVDTGAALDGAPSYPETVAEVLPRWLALAQKHPRGQTYTEFDLQQTFFRTICHDDSKTGPPHCLPRGIASIKFLADMAWSYLAWESQPGPQREMPNLIHVGPLINAHNVATGVDYHPHSITSGLPTLLPGSATHLAPVTTTGRCKRGDSLETSPGWRRLRLSSRAATATLGRVPGALDGRYSLRPHGCRMSARVASAEQILRRRRAVLRLRPHVWTDR